MNPLNERMVRQKFEHVVRWGCGWIKLLRECNEEVGNYRKARGHFGCRGYLSGDAGVVVRPVGNARQDMSKVLTVDEELWQVCRNAAVTYAARFGLKLKKVKVLPAYKDFYGDCSNDGRIRVQLRQGDEALLPYQILDTMAHELAHLKHNNHKSAWFRLHIRILTLMEQEGVYKRLRQLHKKRK